MRHTCNNANTTMSTMENRVYLLLGSNEGDRVDWLMQCMKKLSQSCGRIAGQSGMYETAAWGLEDQPDFLNMAVCLDTTLLPEQLLQGIQQVEKELGRQREVKWGQRTLDIDILLYNDDIIRLPHLTVPHPYMQDRRFVLVPLHEIAPQLLHPVFHKTIAQLLEECPDKLEVKYFGS